MARPLLTTQTEQEHSVQQKTVGMLVYVLRYDDLPADDSMILPPITREGTTYEVGRAPEVGPVALEGSTLLLPDPFVSRTHARLVRRRGADVIEDLGSKLGTFVNGKRIEGPRVLVDGDLLEIGHSLFVYRLVEPRMAGRMASLRKGLSHGPTRTLCPELAGISTDLERIARTDQPVLLLAETGAGKEIAARFVHEKSGRAGPFVAVDCGAIPDHLVEGELFGHRRGAFSGAVEERKGRIRSAEGGTVFLDEIGNLLESAQASLLRVIQEREVTPVGGERPQKVDVRWIAATNESLFAEDSRFRADLRARLAGYVALLPPLRKRREDLGVLCADILGKTGLPSVAITKRAARALFFGDLPGNIRELERSLSSAAVLKGDGPIDLPHLSVVAARAAGKVGARAEGSAADASPSEPSPSAELPRERSTRPPREAIEAALVQAKRVQGEAARLLGVHERQLARWMDAYGIPRGKKSASET
ncbi:sigma 54-interacting transcriptional regulator [Polyangium mundeleinium]|uniref:Sigma 54-interacting transcriptional regulator n=1 Tax=Polyangium mundeleinium TaxID=2995306 RepID=A0ABT5F001_9BACT|nr:sigma 54-interacting transcriptional regulator [Polyangium mundeleinium]MDC0747410.1 sigma 54-interacting transcriptional regulator [Polyangium mundeleinium]